MSGTYLEPVFAAELAALIGIKVKEGANLTVEFVRKVFLRLHQKVSEMILTIGRLLD